MKTETLTVTGMTCGGCTSKVEQALKAVSGVNDVAVSLKNNEATVHYDEQLTAPDKLKLAIHDAGYGVDTENAIHGQQAKGCCC
jgi:copper chaperone CopZ